MKSILRSGHARNLTSVMRLILTTFVGIVFGFFLGVSFPTLSLTKENIERAMNYRSKRRISTALATDVSERPKRPTHEPAPAGTNARVANAGAASNAPFAIVGAAGNAPVVANPRAGAAPNAHAATVGSITAPAAANGCASNAGAAPNANAASNACAITAPATTALNSIAPAPPKAPLNAPNAPALPSLSSKPPNKWGPFSPPLHGGNKTSLVPTSTLSNTKSIWKAIPSPSTTTPPAATKPATIKTAAINPTRPAMTPPSTTKPLARSTQNLQPHLQQNLQPR